MAWKMAWRATNWPSRSCPWSIRAPMSACWRRSVFVTCSVLRSSCPSWSRRTAMIDDSVLMFVTACGNSGQTLELLAQHRQRLRKLVGVYLLESGGGVLQ